jgi:hypothetical protein
MGVISELSLACNLLSSEVFINFFELDLRL